ncbi:MAG: phenylalanyl-tRNA synthetase subunit beta [Gemmobacter sp.]
MRTRTMLGLGALAALVIGAHVALWLSPDMPGEMKLRLTLLNAAGWAVVLIPALAVSMWARAHRRSPRGKSDRAGREP